MNKDDYINQFEDDLTPEMILALDLIETDKWISVSKERPNNRREVIIFYDNKYVTMGAYNNEHEYWDRHPYFIGQINVTHWQEKPKPPITNKPKKRGGCNQLGG